MRKSQALTILKEHNSRRRLVNIDWFDDSFPEQDNFILDPAKFKAAQCTRRAGKTYGAGKYLFKEAAETPNCKVLYISLTRQSAKDIMLDDVLQVINRKYNVGAKVNYSELSLRLPNNSKIMMFGVDSSEAEMSKIFGQKFKLIVIDEAASYKIDLNRLVYEVCDPTTTDWDGTIAMISTTSQLHTSLYFDVTNDKEPGWSVHKWSALNNPFMKEKHAAKIKRLMENKPGIEETPAFQRMYLNKWYIDEDAMVYRFMDSRNSVEELPAYDSWTYILGIDLGWNDDTAFSVCAYNQNDPNLYVIEEYSRSQMLLSPEDGVAETDKNICVSSKIKELESRYNFEVMVIDNASKQVVEELKQRYGFWLIPAEKTDKRGYIELMNADFITGNIKLLEKSTPKLRAEYGGLIWDPKAKLKGKYTEHSSCPNHLSDATLYAWRWAYNYGWVKAEKTIEPGSMEEQKEMERLEDEKFEREELMPEWERDFCDDDEY